MIWKIHPFMVTLHNNPFITMTSWPLLPERWSLFSPPFTVGWPYFGRKIEAAVICGRLLFCLFDHGHHHENKPGLDCWSIVTPLFLSSWQLTNRQTYDHPRREGCLWLDKWVSPQEMSWACSNPQNCQTGSQTRAIVEATRFWEWLVTQWCLMTKRLGASGLGKPQ